MSLNRYEQTIFDYWQKQPEERSHWQSKVTTAARLNLDLGEVTRGLERDLWDYFLERAEHVPGFRDLQLSGVRRVSLLNLADHALRLWGPPRKPKNPNGPKV